MTNDLLFIFLNNSYNSFVECICYFESNRAIEHFANIDSVQRGFLSFLRKLNHLEKLGNGPTLFA